MLQPKDVLRNYRATVHRRLFNAPAEGIPLGFF